MAELLIAANSVTPCAAAATATTVAYLAVYRIKNRLPLLMQISQFARLFFCSAKLTREDLVWTQSVFDLEPAPILPCRF